MEVEPLVSLVPSLCHGATGWGLSGVSHHHPRDQQGSGKGPLCLSASAGI